MRRMKWLAGAVYFLSVVGFLSLASRAQAAVIISELLADPANGISGDSNGDGTRDSDDDEFVELFNTGNASVDISGWLLKDASATRHILPANTILLARQYLVIFGGGSPVVPDVSWQVVSTGTLSLSNSSDTVNLFNAQNALIDQVAYGSLANNDQSIMRWPQESSASFVRHSTLAEAQGRLFSPGTNVDGTQEKQAVVPEPITLVTILLGFVFLRHRFLFQ